MKVKVLNLDNVPDSDGEIISADGIVMPEGKIPVQFRFSEDLRDQMGVATLERREDGIYADIQVYGNWASDVEKAAKSMYPAIGGVTFEKHENVIRGCRITRISLSHDRNSDHRIATVGDQLETQKP